MGILMSSLKCGNYRMMLIFTGVTHIKLKIVFTSLLQKVDLC